MSLLGLDVGITGCKAVVFDETGLPMAKAYREYRLYQPQPGWMELNPEEVWQAVAYVIGSVTQRVTGDPVTALSISTHGESVVPVDENGNLLYGFISAIDTRASQQADWWSATVGRKRIFEITGMPLHPMYTINKLMWLRDYSAEVYNAADRFLCMQDFIFFRLGLPPTMDYTLAARTMAFDVRTASWSDELLSWAQIDPDRFSTVAASGTVIGHIPDTITQKLGLASGAVGVTGGHDQPCGALGCGAVGAGIAMDSTGTVECVAVASPRLVLDDLLLESNLPIARHTAANLYLTMGWTSTGGALLRWYRDNFGQAEVAEASRRQIDVYDLLLESIEPEPSPVLVLPHFMGSGTPWLDAASKGVILGLDLSTDNKQVLKGIVDSVTYETKLSVDAMEAAGIAVEEMRAFGGGAKSPLWLQTKADIFGKPVRVMDVTDAPSLGAAMLAGIATGVFADLDEAQANMVRIRETIQPDQLKHAQYMEKYALFQEIYPTLAGLNRRL